MIFFDCDEAPSSSPKKIAFALAQEFPLADFAMIAILKRVQDCGDKSKEGVLHLLWAFWRICDSRIIPIHLRVRTCLGID